MERNWLIRTTQNQILGPVAKAKVVEFFQKGALGLNDEVTSGNGYWFFLKEKDLVEKYLYGDLPQGYNPISESKSVLSRRDNPDKTTSLNNSPANKTQSLKIEGQAPGVLPANDDLEFPDITTLNNDFITQLDSEVPGEIAKIPTSDDLEFPDITLIKQSVNSNLQTNDVGNAPAQLKSRAKEVVEISMDLDSEPIIYPESSDLDYPDINNISLPESADTLVLSSAEKELTLEILAPLAIEQDEETTKADLAEWDGANLPVVKKEKKKEAPKEEKKLLHERKVKASTKEQTSNVPNKEIAEEKAARAMPDHLKKRNDNYLMYVLVILVLIIIGLFFYYYSNILNKPLTV